MPDYLLTLSTAAPMPNVPPALSVSYSNGHMGPANRVLVINPTIGPAAHGQRIHVTVPAQPAAGVTIVGVATAANLIAAPGARAAFTPVVICTPLP